MIEDYTFRAVSWIWTTYDLEKLSSETKHDHELDYTPPAMLSRTTCAQTHALRPKRTSKMKHCHAKPSECFKLQVSKLQAISSILHAMHIYTLDLE